MFYVYVLRSETSGGWYTGCTNDLRKRFREHASGKANYTAKKGPYEVIYYEACIDEGDAYRREQYLKTGMGKRYIRNRLKRFLTLTG